MKSTNIQVPIDLSYYSKGRSRGLHLSGILKKMGERAGALKPQTQENDLGWLSKNLSPVEIGKSGPMMRAIMGHAWEAWMAQQVKRIDPTFAHQPFELERNGIFGTPDGTSMDPETGEWVLHEFKWTMKSVKPVVEESMWMWQVVGYLAMLSEKYGEPVVKAVVHPVYPLGDRKNMGALYLPQLVEFEQEEVETAWGEILEHKELAEAE